MNSIAHEPLSTFADSDMKLRSRGYLNDHQKLRSQNKTLHTGLQHKINLAGTPKLSPKEINDILDRVHDSGEGILVKSILSMVYDNQDELLTKVDEYYGMPVPTLIRTDQWHRIINTDVEEARNMGSISFDSNYSFADIKKLIINNEFIK